MTDDVFYVYQYIDPRSGVPFYVGKGKGRRAFDHLKETPKRVTNWPKHKRIQELLSLGIEPVVTIVVQGVSEIEAYALETAMIQTYGRIGIDETGVLTNIIIDSKGPGMLGKHHTEETKNKLRTSLTGHRHTPETIQKIRNAALVNKPWEKTSNLPWATV